MSEDTFTVHPTVLVCVDDAEGVLGVVSAGEGPEKALIVFSGPEDAFAFRRTTGKYTEAEGFRVVGMTRDAVAGLLDKQGLSRVMMPEAWTGDHSGGVDEFTAENFLALLDDAEPV